MTDNKIIKLLECKQKCLCDDCKVKNTLCCEVCIVTIQKQAIDIITRQKDEIERLNTALDMAMKFHSEAADERDSANTEIERLQTDNSSMQSTLAKMSMGVEQAKAEAIKEFASAYKDQIKCCTGMFDDDGEIFYIPLDAALNSVNFIYERMVGN